MAQSRRLFVAAAALADVSPSFGQAPAPAEPAPRLALDEDEAHYAKDVLRLADGDTVDVLDGHGHAAPAVLRLSGSGRRSTAWAEACGPWRLHPALDNAPQLTVVVALPKGERADWMVEKLAELACAAVVVVHTARSVPLAGAGASKRLERLARVARAACRQARHGRVPTLSTDILPLAEALGPAGPIAADAQRWVADLAEGLPWLVAAASRTPSRHHAVLLGPEGGLTCDELNQARAFGYTPVGLGPHVLRVETAAVAAAVAVAGAVPAAVDRHRG